MKRHLPLLVSVLLAGLSGCQCCGLTDRYADRIDDVSDRELSLDGLYHPCFDLSRIGKPDWMCCGFNRLWCRSGGVHCCGQCPCPFCAKETGVDPAAYQETQPETDPEGPPLPGVPPQPKPETETEELPTLLLLDEASPQEP